MKFGDVDMDGFFVSSIRIWVSRLVCFRGAALKVILQDIVVAKQRKFSGKLGRQSRKCETSLHRHCGNCIAVPFEVSAWKGAVNMCDVM